MQVLKLFQTIFQKRICLFIINIKINIVIIIVVIIIIIIIIKNERAVKLE